MRKFTLLVVAILATTYHSFAQSSLQPSGVDLDYVAGWGDVLIRFEDNLSISFDKYNTTGYAPIDAILQDLDIKEVEQLSVCYKHPG